MSPAAALAAGRARSGIIIRRLFGSLEARVPTALGFKSKLIFPESAVEATEQSFTSLGAV